jgi:hypothetical protein
MKKINLFLTISMLLVGSLAYSQSYTFRVLANKGANQIKSGDSWQPLKTGASLKDSDEIKVAEDAYLGLMHVGGKSVEWREAGTFKVSDMASKVPAGKSVGAKYADFLASKMTAEAKKNRLSATGAVHRGAGDAEINVYAPSGSVQIYNDNAVIRWDPLEGDNIGYKVIVADMFEDVLLTESTNETFYKLDLNNPSVKDKDILLLSVTTSEDEDIKSQSIAIKKLPKDDMQKVDDGLGELMTDIDEESALNKYILAGFYEDQNLLIDALTNYERAIELAPEVETFKEAYEEFLLRNGLKSSK